MKRFFITSFFILTLLAIKAQNFTWLRGSQGKNIPGVYGTKGID